MHNFFDIFDGDYDSNEEATQLEISKGKMEPGFVVLNMDFNRNKLIQCETPQLIIEYRYNDDDIFEKAVLTLRKLHRVDDYVLKVDRSFTDYTIVIRAAIIDGETGEFVYLQSNELTLNIESDAKDQKWEVGECCFIHPILKTYSECHIIDVLPNDRYTVDANNGPFEVSSDELRSNAKLWYALIDTSRWQEVDRCMIFQGAGTDLEAKHYSLVMGISKMIEVAVSHPATTRTAVSVYPKSGVDHVLINASRAISIAVLNYLYSYKYRFRLGCVRCDMANVHSNYHYRISSHDVKYTGSVCSKCMVELCYGSVYICPNEVKLHKLCIDCAFSIAVRHRYWNDVLIPLLSDVMEIDCISNIVMYLVGSASLIDTTSNNPVSTLFPVAKKRDSALFLRFF